MKEFWDERYADEEYAYGESPNVYFSQKLAELPQGKILLPAEGEGRNGVFAAKQGWEVDAFDVSKEGKRKTELLAEKYEVKVNYSVGTLEDTSFQKESYDAIGLVFSHFPPHIRKEYHAQFSELLKTGGVVIGELFSKKNLENIAKNPNVGGPRDEKMLLSLEEIREEFPNFEFIELSQEDVELSEGKYHVGIGNVIRFMAKKL